MVETQLVQFLGEVETLSCNKPMQFWSAGAEESAVIKKIPASLRQNLLGSVFSAHRLHGPEGTKAAPLQ